MPKIAFVDLLAQYHTIENEINGAIAQVIAETAFIKGRFVSTFEEQFALYVGRRHCIGCANGTDAIEIALKAMGIGHGDEVIVPANTFIATSEAVTTAGAKPVFVDNDPDTYTIDVHQIEARITPSTKAIIPVHLYGLPAEMDSIVALAKKYSLKVIEDCSQAHGAKYRGKRIGTFGDAATYSFFPGKNLGAYGDAGGIVTDDEELATKCRMVANHGRVDKYDHIFEGRNSRLDGLQAAILSVKLKHIERWSEMRRSRAALYNSLLADSGLVLPRVPDYMEPVYHLYVVRSPERDALQSHLKSKEVETGIHYPIPLPFLRAYSHLGHVRTDFPVAAAQMSQILSLPLYPEMTDDQVRYVAQCIQDFKAAEGVPQTV